MSINKDTFIDEQKAKEDRADIKIARLLSYMMVFDIISLGVNSIVNSFISYGTIIDSLLLYIILLSLYAFSFVEIIKRMSSALIIFLVISCLLTLSNMLLHNTIDLAKPDEFYYLYIGILILIPLGASIKNYELLYDYMGKIYSFAIIFGFIHLILTFYNSSRNGLWMSDMTSSYSLLPSTLFAIEYSYRHKAALFFSILGIITILLFGSRWPVFILLTFSIITFLRYSTNRKRALILSIIIIIIYFIYTKGYQLKFITFLSLILSKYNIKIASFVKIIENVEISNGRNIIYTKAIKSLWEKPLFGLGIFYDRSISVYSHNFILEILLDFGLAIGILIISSIVIMMNNLLKNTIEEKNTKKLSILLIIFCSVFGELTVSNSYIREPFFYIAVGMMLSFTINKKNLHTLPEGVENE